MIKGHHIGTPKIEHDGQTYHLDWGDTKVTVKSQGKKVSIPNETMARMLSVISLHELVQKEIQRA